MTLPAPAALLRHRPPALVLDAIESAAGSTLRCRAHGAGPWAWPVMLEGAAQCAGLLAGLQPGGPGNTAVIAEYRAVAVHVRSHAGPLAFVAHLERRLLHFWRCRVEVRAADDALLLEGSITVAPERSPEPSPEP